MELRVLRRPKPRFGHLTQSCALTVLKDCGGSPCAQHCEWSNWGEWGACTKPCGAGTHTRNRTVQTAAEHGGSCEGEATESHSCNTQKCPVNCKVGTQCSLYLTIGQFNDWSSWSACDVKCGAGQRTRTRNEVTAKFGGLVRAGSRFALANRRCTDVSRAVAGTTDRKPSLHSNRRVSGKLRVGGLE